MKMYKHSYDLFYGKLKTIEFDVEEKQKTYKVLPGSAIWQCRILKKDVEILDSYGDSMFSLSDDASKLLELMMDRENRRVEALLSALEKRKRNIEKLKDALGEFLSESEE